MTDDNRYRSHREELEKSLRESDRTHTILLVGILGGALAVISAAGFLIYKGRVEHACETQCYPHPGHLGTSLDRCYCDETQKAVDP
jgi:hypothetical protein